MVPSCYAVSLLAHIRRKSLTSNLAGFDSIM